MLKLRSLEMINIKRYMPNNFGYLVPDPDGQWMRVSEHDLIVKAMQFELAAVMQSNDNLRNIILEEGERA